MPVVPITPSRLRFARRRAQLTMKDLAEQAGVASKMITEYEKGRTVPEAETVASLAAVLGFSPDFFYGPDLPSLDAENVSFRSLSKLTARQREGATSAGELAIWVHDWIAERFKLPSPRLPQLDGTDPEVAAQALRDEWGMGDSPAGSMVNLLEAHGVRTFTLAERGAEVDAFSCWHDSLPFVFLNTQKSAERSRMDAAHELAHLVLHHHQQIARNRDVEREAKQFASAFLMPESDLRLVMQDYPNPTMAQLLQLKQRWNVALVALVYRLNRLEIISEWHSRILWREIAKRGMRTREPDPQALPESSELLGAVFSGLRGEGMTMGSIARQLGISLSQMNELVFGLVIGPIDGGRESGSEPTHRPGLYLVE